MPNVRFIHLLFLCLCAVAAPALAAEQERFVIEAENDSLEFDLTTGTITYTNGVTVKYGDARLSARKARLNQDSGDVLAEGDVRLQRQNEVWYGDRIEYNFKSQKILASNFKAGQPPFFVKGAALAGDQTNEVYVLADAIVTTDDYAEPGYRIRAGTLSIAPGELPHRNSGK